jgi:hypothetical protein
MSSGNPLGTLKLPVLSLPFLPTKHFTVTGGPSQNCDIDSYTFVKMAKEINLPCDISIPTRDFSVPEISVLNSGLIEAVRLVTRGEPVWVGCRAGRGRTGLFMAILAKAFGIRNPVEYVRANYFAHAVETEEQYAFVTTYQIPKAVQDLILQAKGRAFWTLPWATNLTNLPKNL